MNLIVNIYYKGENGNAKKFAEEMISKGIVDRVRNEDGNLRYEYFYSMEDPETVMLIDKWEDEKALDAHHKSSMMKEIAELRENYELSMKVEKYTEVKQWKK